MWELRLEDKFRNKIQSLISFVVRSPMQSNLNTLLVNIASLKEKASNKYSY